jgi:hypothetical protein
VPFTFTGDSTLTYVQYMDVQADRTLIAAPGGSYEMTPAGNWNLPVPPADGRWESAEGGDGDPPAAEPEAAVPPLNLMTGAGTSEDEEN